MKQILIEHKVRFELLDLRKEDPLRLLVKSWAQSDFARQRPQNRLERRDRAVQPSRHSIACDGSRSRRRLDSDAVFTRPGRLHPGVVDVDVGGDVSKLGKISGIEIGDAEQAGVAGRNLRRILSVRKAWMAPVLPGQEARIVGIEDEDAHENPLPFQNKPKSPAWKFRTPAASAPSPASLSPAWATSKRKFPCPGSKHLDITDEPPLESGTSSRRSLAGGG
ncbi:hypothetical protein ACTGJ9_018735 [Bradyrhizobium sp. RDM12]